MINTNNLKEVFESLQDYIGLKYFSLDVVKDNFGFDYYVKLYKKIDRIELLENNNDSVIIKNITSPIFDGIKNSKYVEECLSEIPVLKRQIEELNKEVSRLKEFETYYNLTFQMEHGNNEK